MSDLAVAAWMTPPEEAAALRRASSLVGCKVQALAPRRTLAGLRTAGQLTCSDGWQAARLLVALAAEDAKTAGARDLALELRASAPSDDAFARAVHRLVRERVRFVREPGEVFTGASYTLASGAGDCDDHARLVFALLRAGGLPARMAYLYKRGAPGPSHVVAQAGVGGRWYYLETTIPAAFGEHPIDAGRRVGVLSARSDLNAAEVRTMSEKDLPTPPAGFLTRTTAALLSQDAQALAALGLGALCDPLDPADPAFRENVATFQASHGLTVDGLIGPKTRAALAAELRAQGLGELADAYEATIGASSPGTFTHAQAREVMGRAFRTVFGRDGSPNAIAFACAVAFAETGYGRAPGQFAGFAAQGAYNWGALERGRPPCGPGFVAGKDAGRDGCFYAYPDDDQAAAALLRSWAKPDTLEAAESGDAFAVAAAMRRHGYYEGFWLAPGTTGRPMPPFKYASSPADAEARNVADYAALLTRNVAIVSGTGGIPDPPRLLARVGPLLALLALGGAAWYAHHAGYL